MPNHVFASVAADVVPSGPQTESRLPLPPETLLEAAVLMIDFDGTLVEIAERPDAVVVDAPLRTLLEALARRFPDRLAIVSGRSIEQLDGFLGGFGQAVALIGSHGVERRLPRQAIERPEPPASLAAIAARLDAYVAEHSGTLVERKSLGVALHYRAAPQLEQDARAFTEHLAEAFGVPVQHGKMMSELRSGVGDKGTAVRRYAEERAGCVPVFLGDDLTDEPAFAVARELGGAGVLIGDRSPSAALYALPGVAEARAWLARGARA